jgi:hypothetical protein
MVQQKSMATIASGAVVGVTLLAIPLNLMRINWHEHDRSGNFLAWDYSYNMLQTCEKDAILFTNGDNDTFPLWYLQDVEGIRRDVRVVCLSLVNTPWYIELMKKKPYYTEALAVPISFTDAEIERIQPVQWEPRQMRLPVPRPVLDRYGVTDTATINHGAIEFTMKNTLEIGGTKALRVQDIMIHNIIFTNQWKRPVYFSSGVPPDSWIGLDDYARFGGLAWHIEPRKVAPSEAGVDLQVLEANLFSDPKEFPRTPQYGYRFRNVANPDVYFDEEASKYVSGYRTAFIRLAMYYANVAKDSAKSIAALDRMEHIVPRSKIPLGWELGSDIASFYYRLGRYDTFNEIATEIEPVCRTLIGNKQVNMRSYYNPYRVLLSIYEARKDDAKQLELLRELSEMYPADSGIKERINAIQADIKLQQDTAHSPAK